MPVSDRRAYTPMVVSLPESTAMEASFLRSTTPLLVGLNFQDTPAAVCLTELSESSVP